MCTHRLRNSDDAAKPTQKNQPYHACERKRVAACNCTHYTKKVIPHIFAQFITLEQTNVRGKKRVDAHCPHLIESSSNPNLDVKKYLCIVYISYI